MGTIGQMVDTVISEAYGHTQTVDVDTYLLAPVTATDTEFAVASAANFSRGIVQVEFELFQVDSVDRSLNRLQCGHVMGRGVRGTTAASHAAGVRVTMNPTISRQAALRAIEDALKERSGLFRVASATHTISAADPSYSVPADCDILDVSWLPPGPGGNWQPCRRWRHDRVGSLLYVFDSMTPGRTLRVSYATVPTVPALGAEFSTSGLPSSCEDVIRLGALWRLMTTLETFTLMPQAAEASTRVQQPRRLQVAQYVYQLYLQRLSTEVAELNRANPIRSHYGG